MRPSPNIWHHPEIYELENRAVDPDGKLADALSSLATWADRTVLDLGCGTGFHLPWFAQTAHRVFGVEPHPKLMGLAQRRTYQLGNVSVLSGTAQALPLPDHTIDFMHARWAYFFGPGCEPGLAELSRVMRRGGTAVIIDNDPTVSTFGAWFRRGFPEVDPEAVQRFWSRQGWQRHPVTMRWQFATREDFAAVVGIEFNPETAAWILEHHLGSEVDYAVNVWWRHF